MKEPDKHGFITTQIYRLLFECKSKIAAPIISLHHKVLTDESMCRADEKDKVWQFNGELGTITDNEGRQGKIILTLDFRDAYEIVEIGKN